MKKVILLAVVVALSTSCKKKRICQCTYIRTGSNPSTEVNNYTIKDTKRKAKTQCEAYQSSGSTGSYSWSQTCELT